MTRTCSDCPTPITAKSKTGRCRSCAARAMHADPVFRARLNAKVRIAKASAEHRAKASEASRRMHAERATDPDWQAHKRAQGERLRRQYDGSPEAQARNLAARDRAGETNSDRLLAWCPRDRRAEYRGLRSRHGAAEARRIIEADLYRPRRAAPKRQLTFAEQLERVAAGAPLVARPDTRRRGDHDFTLGGVASGLL